MAKRNEHDLGLKCLQQAFGLESLHFGLFTEDQPYTLEALKQAQMNYKEALTGMIPDGVKSVLDVGSGLGDTSKMLIEKGYDTEGLSPDKYHGEKFQEINAGSVFHLARFEDLKTDKKYDCLLFGESPQYIEKEAFFPKCLEITEPGSCIVLAEFFQIQPGDSYPNCWIEEEFVKAAEASGYRTDYHRDITKQVLPNLEVALLFLSYGQKLFHFVKDSARRNKPFLWFLARLFYGRKLKKVDQVLNENAPKWLDPERFEKNMHYAMYRFIRK
ncbi:MAG: hypothetical protein JW909_09495 [Planctomycetes bacterium]|nr:hypothetical protein [Planctomycetota bacterium]